MKLLPLFAAVLAIATVAPLQAAERAVSRPNVLFISIDDLRPQLGCYGDGLVKTPHIDRLAAQGIVFERAYCQVAVCSPSRMSMLSGRRPDTVRIFNLTTPLRKTLPKVVTLPQLFKNHGYTSVAIGKIFHTAGGSELGQVDDPQSWTRPQRVPDVPRYGPDQMAIIRKKEETARARGVDLSDYHNMQRGLPYGAPEVMDHELVDGAIADEAIKELAELKDQPFFLAVGFINPHLPFVAPKKYWDLYDPAQIQLPENRFRPKGAPSYAAEGGTDWRLYDGTPKQGPPSPELARKLLHGYLAATSYVDAQVGRILQELDRLGLRKNTIIVLWGDHGFQIGEHNLWANKHTNYETSARVPLILSTPAAQATGQKTRALIESVDIYPTLADLAGLPAPAGLEGTSFVPVLHAPGQPWKSAAFSQYPKSRNGAPLMGYSMRTERYRFTRWVHRKDPSKVDAVELYDHETDPQENVNIANAPENAALLEQLTAQWQKGWRGALPGTAESSL